LQSNKQISASGFPVVFFPKLRLWWLGETKPSMCGITIHRVIDYTESANIFVFVTLLFSFARRYFSLY